MEKYTKEELYSMTLTRLKELASVYDIPGRSTYKKNNKNDLADRIFIKQTTNADDDPLSGILKTKKPDKPDKPIDLLDTKQPKFKKPLKIDDKIPPKIPKIKLSKIDYNFTDVMDIEVSLEIYEPTQSVIPTAEDVTPELLLQMINKDDSFCTKVATSLRDIYQIKYEKYKKLIEKTEISIKNDKEEKSKMFHAIDKQDLDKLFPMIITNTAFLTKIEKLTELSLERYRQFSDISPSIIRTVKKNLITAITDEEDGIVSISGDTRATIRNDLCKQLFILSKGYRPFMDAFLNMVFTGPAGVGKTKLAKTFGFVFQNSGILLKGELVVVSPKDMIGEYVGHTAVKAAGVLMKGLESIIFLDEAYQLMPCFDGKIKEDAKTFGPEAITEIVNFLDKNIGMSIMIVAGYQREIDGCFFAANEGLRRRFPNTIGVPSYSNSDLLNIFLNESVKRIGTNIFTKQIAMYIYTLIVKLSEKDPKIFINQAGDMMNLTSMFLSFYYGSYGYDWGTYENDLVIVNGTFNNFLRNKGYKMRIGQLDFT